MNRFGVPEDLLGTMLGWFRQLLRSLPALWCPSMADFQLQWSVSQWS